MGLFSKNPNEAAYAGGKKHFIDVIKNTGDGDLLIWRQPEEDFNTNSKLIVMPGEQAIFVDGGNIVQTFDEGTYELTTNNYPFISRLKNTLSGGISTFNCVVYFFRKADSRELKWGTDDPIQVRDKIYGIRTDVRARGTYKIRVENPALFLEKMVGNNIAYQKQTDLNQYFRHEMLTKIKSSVAKFLNEYQNELIGIEAYLSDISRTLQPQINEMISDYGMYCVNFSIAAFDVDTDKYDEIDTAQVQSLKKMKEAQGEQAYMNTLGQNWDKLQTAGILSDLAQNEGAGGIGSLGAGLGMGVAAGGAFGQMAGQMFGGQQGMQQADNQTNDPMAVLTKLKQMLENGLIEQEEYDAKKKEILSRM